MGCAQSSDRYSRKGRRNTKKKRSSSGGSSASGGSASPDMMSSSPSEPLSPRGITLGTPTWGAPSMRGSGVGASIAAGGHTGVTSGPSLARGGIFPRRDSEFPIVLSTRRVMYEEHATDDEAEDPPVTVHNDAQNDECEASKLLMSAEDIAAAAAAAPPFAATEAFAEAQGHQKRSAVSDSPPSLSAPCELPQFQPLSFTGAPPVSPPANVANCPAEEAESSRKKSGSYSYRNYRPARLDGSTDAVGGCGSATAANMMPLSTQSTASTGVTGGCSLESILVKDSPHYVAFRQQQLFLHQHSRSVSFSFSSASSLPLPPTANSNEKMASSSPDAPLPQQQQQQQQQQPQQQQQQQQQVNHPQRGNFNFKLISSPVMRNVSSYGPQGDHKKKKKSDDNNKKDKAKNAPSGGVGFGMGTAFPVIRPRSTSDGGAGGGGTGSPLLLLPQSLASSGSQREEPFTRTSTGTAHPLGCMSQWGRHYVAQHQQQQRSGQTVVNGEQRRAPGSSSRRRMPPSVVPANSVATPSSSAATGVSFSADVVYVLDTGLLAPTSPSPGNVAHYSRPRNLTAEQQGLHDNQHQQPSNADISLRSLHRHGVAFDLLSTDVVDQEPSAALLPGCVPPEEDVSSSAPAQRQAPTLTPSLVSDGSKDRQRVHLSTLLLPSNDGEEPGILSGDAMECRLSSPTSPSSPFSASALLSPRGVRSCSRRRVPRKPTATTTTTAGSSVVDGGRALLSPPPRHLVGAVASATTGNEEEREVARSEPHRRVHVAVATRCEPNRQGPRPPSVLVPLSGT